MSGNRGKKMEDVWKRRQWWDVSKLREKKGRYLRRKKPREELRNVWKLGQRNGRCGKIKESKVDKSHKLKWMLTTTKMVTCESVRTLMFLRF